MRTAAISPSTGRTGARPGRRTPGSQLVPEGLLGRVSSLDWFISIALMPLSYALTAPTAHLFGARPTLIAAGVLGGAITLGALYIPGMREPDGYLAGTTTGSVDRRILPEAA